MKGSPKYRTIQSDLDKIGLMTAIVREGAKTYTFIINGQVIKCFKRRDSINRRLLKLHKKHIKTQSN
ncbi:MULTISPECIES: hypothetical protein [Flavobacterium]|uniref:Uncharacterized protein n=1 Tax=Flavobacterium jumunjinense TaxID=998845 RepID=A0ABV5GUD8_9FLAO|nr:MULTISPECIES: hypothetical protein [Flavobacterium]